MRDLRAIIKMISHLLPGYAWRLVAVSVVTGVAPLVNIIFPRLIIEELLGDKNMTTLVILVAALAFGNLLSMLLDRALSNRLTAMTTLSFAQVEEMLSKKALRVPLAVSESKTNLDLMERATHGIYSLHTLDLSMKKLGGSVVSLLSVMVIVLTGSPLLALFVLALNLPSIYCLKKLKSLEAENVERVAHVDRAFRYFSRLPIDYRYSKDLKLYHGVDLMMHKAQDTMDRIFSINHQYFTKMGFWNGVLGSLVEIQSVVVFAYLGLRLLLKQLSIGAFTMLYGASRQMGRALNNLMQGTNELLTINMHLRPVMEYLELPEYEGDLTENTVRNDLDNKEYLNLSEYESDLAENTVRNDLDNLDYLDHLDGNVRQCLLAAYEGKLEWVIKDLSFRYPSGHDFVLKNCSLRIHSGERVALVGSNGAGKSTLVKLLCRYYEQEEGSITLNGVDIRKIPLHLYNKVLSPTFQDFNLFSFQIIENVACVESEEISQDQREASLLALDRLGLTDWTKELPHTIHTYHSENLAEDGVLPSGGEKQKLALARSLSHGGSFLIMDEPTAALDPRSEEEIFHQMLTLSENRTSLFISHRLSSTRYADRILVLDDGHVTEEGNHAKLILESGLYAKMYKAQASQYNESKR